MTPSAGSPGTARRPGERLWDLAARLREAEAQERRRLAWTRWQHMGAAR